MTDIIIPKDEQVERAARILVSSEKSSRFMDVGDYGEARKFLVILLNQDKILGEPPPRPRITEQQRLMICQSLNCPINMTRDEASVWILMHQPRASMIQSWHIAAPPPHDGKKEQT